jgi:hypothetical protein
VALSGHSTIMLYQFILADADLYQNGWVFKYPQNAFISFVVKQSVFCRFNKKIVIVILDLSYSFSVRFSLA